MKKCLSIIILCLCFPLALNAAPLSTETLTIDGLQRSYQWSRPEKIEDPLPLVMVLHGAFLTSNQVIDNALGEWLSIADEEGWVVVYPNGFNLAWNDCRADTNINRNVDDVAFLDAIISLLLADQLIDPKRIYISGVSNGGMMSLRMARESIHPIAAIGTIIASIPADNECLALAQPTSWLLINSTHDETIPWEGGYVSGRQAQGKLLSVVEGVNQWAEVLGITGSATWQKLPDTRFRDQSYVHRLNWQAPISKAEIELYIMSYSGHVTPSIKHPVAFWVELLSGRQNRDIEPAVVMHDFFLRH